MKHYLLTFGFAALLATVGLASAHAAGSARLTDRQKESYEDTVNAKNIVITSSATVWVISTVTVPTNAKGFRLYPVTNEVNFAVQDGATTITISSVTANWSASSVTTFGTGGLAKGDKWETRLLPYTSSSNTRYLYLRSGTASTVITLEFF